MKYIYSFMVLSFFLVSCENDIDIEPSKETFLPKLVMNGDSDVTLSCGASTFSDPGVEATENGLPVNLTTVITGKYFGSDVVDSPDDYEISYSAVNVDGIPGTAFRNVLNPPCNGDLVSSIEGLYSSTVVRNGSSGAAYTDMEYILIRKLSDNVYQLSDAIGGYYDFGRGYGAGYAATGFTITANDIPSNNFSFSPAGPVGAFGGNLTFTSMEVDAASKVINFVTEWDAGYKFEVTLTQIQ